MPCHDRGILSVSQVLRIQLSTGMLLAYEQRQLACTEHAAIIHSHIGIASSHCQLMYMSLHGTAAADSQILSWMRACEGSSRARQGTAADYLQVNSSVVTVQNTLQS